MKNTFKNPVSIKVEINGQVKEITYTTTRKVDYIAEARAEDAREEEELENRFSRNHK
jgi:hypothetical protein